MSKKLFALLFVCLFTFMVIPGIYATQQTNCSADEALMELSKKIFSNSDAIHIRYKGTSQFVKGTVKMDRTELSKYIQTYDHESSGCMDAPLIIAIPKNAHN